MTTGREEARESSHAAAGGMSLDVARAIQVGLGRLATPLGGRIVLLFLGIRFVSTVGSQTLVAANRAVMAELPSRPPIPIGPETTPLALPISLGPAIGLTLLVSLLAEAAHIVAIRFVVAERPAAVGIDRLTRGLPAATIRGFLAGIVAGVGVLLGLAALVLPGLFLMVSFAFVRQEIAIRDASVIDALADSWSLTAGNRTDVLVVLAVVFGVGVLASVPSILLPELSPIGGSLLIVGLSTLSTVFGLAVISRAYAQLDADRAERLAIEDGRAGWSRGP